MFTILHALTHNAALGNVTHGSYFRVPESTFTRSVLAAHFLPAGSGGRPCGGQSEARATPALPEQSAASSAPRARRETGAPRSSGGAAPGSAHLDVNVGKTVNSRRH